MDKPLLEAFRNFRNALICGALLLAALYLWVAPWWIGFTDFGAVATPATSSIIHLLGNSGLVIVALVGSTLIGETWTRAVTRVQIALARRLIDRLYADFLSLSELRPRLTRLTRLGRRVRPFSNAVVYRLVRRFERYDDFEKAGPVLASTQVRNALKRSLFMGPRLIIARPELFMEHQKSRADAELCLSLVLPLPLCLGLFVYRLNDVPTAFWAATLSLCLASAALLLLQGWSLWRQASSQLVHGLLDTSADLSDLLEDTVEVSMPLTRDRFSALLLRGSQD